MQKDMFGVLRTREKNGIDRNAGQIWEKVKRVMVDSERKPQRISSGMLW